MAKSRGLIITLVIFIILTLSLGVVAYFTAQGYKEAFLKTVEADKQIKEAEGQIRALNADIDKVKGMMGHPTMKTDQLIQTMSNDVNKTLANTTQVPKTYRNAILALADTYTARKAESAMYREQNAFYRTLALNESQKTQTQQNIYAEQRRAADSLFGAQKTRDAKRIADMKMNLEEQDKVIVRIDQETKKVNELFRVQAADAKEVARDITQLNVSLSQKLDSLSRLDSEVPDGAVLYVDQSAQTLRLNIGSAEGVRVQTNFGIYPKNTLDVGRTAPKGTVEVVRVLGEHECEGRIVEEEISNPIMKGDIVYTPLWKAGQQVLFALTYDMDIDGDGKSDVETLKNMIEATGSKVAMWVDENGEMKGQLTPEVSAIITSDRSIVDTLALNNKLDPEVKSKIQDDHMKLLKEAERGSIRELKLSDFLKKIHFRETAQISRFKEPEGVGSIPMGNIPPKFATSPVAPIYIPGKSDKAPVSAGLLAPIYTGAKQQKAPVSTGKVSDYYFRKRK